MNALDLILLALIFLFYGVGDVVSTLYGMKFYDMNEGEYFHKKIFGEKMRWYQSIVAKIFMLSLVAFIYFVARVLYSSQTYQIVWWIIALAIIGQGFRVSYLNFRDIKKVQ